MELKHQKLDVQLERVCQLLSAYREVERHLAITDKPSDRARIHHVSSHTYHLSEDISKNKRFLTREEMREVNTAWQKLKSEFPNLIPNAKRTEQAVCYHTEY